MDVGAYQERFMTISLMHAKGDATNSALRLRASMIQDFPPMWARSPVSPRAENGTPTVAQGFLESPPKPPRVAGNIPMSVIRLEDVGGPPDRAVEVEVEVEV